MSVLPTLSRLSRQASLLAILSAMLVSASTAQAQNPDASAVFTPRGNKLHMTGTIDEQTRSRLVRSLQRNPEVEILVLNDVPGSADDDAALQLYREVRRQRLSTYVPADGIVASGGVDLFCAGLYRKVEAGGMLLVHPWAEGFGFNEVTADQVPRNDRRHRSYLDYYEEMGIDRDFYWHTINAPRSNVRVPGGMIPDMHLMSKRDLVRFGIVTESAESSSSEMEEDDFDRDGSEDLDNDHDSHDLGFIVGDWKFEYEGKRGTISINERGEFEYRSGNMTLTGGIQIEGMTLSLLVENQVFPMEVVSATNNQIRFENLTWLRDRGNRRDEEGEQPRIRKPSLNGDWTEVRNDGREAKMIEISGTRLVEMTRNDEWRATISLNGNRLSMQGEDGSRETFEIEFVGNDRVNFYDPSTGRRVTNFHWERDRN